MEGLVSLDAVYVALVFLVPGYLVWVLRGHFVVVRKTDGPEFYLHLLALSAVNFALSGWTIYLAIAWEAHATVRALLWLTVIVISPAALGVLSGLATRHEWLTKAYQRLKLHPMHSIPNAWDYQFSRDEESWALVMLKDGTRYAGIWQHGSFASTDPAERDLLLTSVHDIPDDGPWSPNGKSVYIAAGEIQTIEFSKLVRE
jgi:hypothetical protein